MSSQSMDQPLLPRVLSKEFQFSIVCGLILGLLCVQTGSSRSPCNLRTQFPCRTTPSICIDLAQVRDGRTDCPDGSDEDGRSAEGQLRCQSGSCSIPRRGYETVTEIVPVFSNEECPGGMHRCICGLPRCIERNKVGDGIKHCQDGSDEGEDESNYLCPESSGDETLFAVEMKKRRRRHTGQRNDPVVYPTGIISAFTGTEVNGDKTTLHTTQVYRTYIDGTYKELLQSTSVIMPTPTLDEVHKMETTAHVQRFGSLNSGKVYLTAVNEPVSAISSSVPGTDQPFEISGTFEPPVGEITTKHFGLDISARTIGVLFPEKTDASIITVTGTEGTFVHHDATSQRAYPVYTGSYISGSVDPTTYKFFFGNHPLTSNVKVILPTVSSNDIGSTEYFAAEESELQGSITRRKDTIADLMFDRKYSNSAEREIPEPYYRFFNNSNEEYIAKPTTLLYAKPAVITRYVQPTAYPETNEPVLAMAGRNTIGIVGNIRKPQQVSTLRGHEGYYRQGRMYNNAATGRRVGPGGATVITDQFFLPTHKMQTSRVEEADAAYNTEVNNAYYEVDGADLKEKLRQIVRPTAAYDRQTVKDKRLTRTVGLYGPIYEIEDLRNEFTTSSVTTSETNPLTTPSTNESNENDFTTTLYGFAEFSTRISGTQYIFLPASTRPRTFTPRVTRTSFSSSNSLILRTRSEDSVGESQPEAFFRKPLYGTETREFISQKSMFTSTVKEPIEIQKTMFTSTVATKQPFESQLRGRKVESNTESVIAETLPLNLATVYDNEYERTRSSADRHLFLNFQSVNKHRIITDSPRELDVSEIVDSVKDTGGTDELIQPTGLVSSITGTQVSDGTTTHWTTLIFGTYIENTYAHIIESTSSIFFTVSNTALPKETLDSENSLGDKITEISRDLPMLEDAETSSGNGIELLSSIADISSTKQHIISKSINSVVATPKLEILTSGFILPRNGRLEDTEPTLSVENSSIDSSSISLTSFTKKSESYIPTPGVIYADEDSSDLPSLASSSNDEAIHIITDSFILPVLDETIESKSPSIKTRDGESSTDQNLFESTSTVKSTSTQYIDDLDRLIIGIPEVSSDKSVLRNTHETADLSVKNESSSLEGRTSLESDIISPSVVLLTGDFILPSESVNSGVFTVENKVNENESSSTTVIAPSILTDGFILPAEHATSTTSIETKVSTPSDEKLSSTSDSVSILTEGFILPAADKELENSKIKTTVVNALPSSALLTADFLLSEETVDKGAAGRSAGDENKFIALDDIINTHVLHSASLPTSKDAGDETIERNHSEDSTIRLGKVLKSIPEAPNPKVEEILPSISFPITYYTTSTYFTTYLLEGSTVVSSRKETVSQVYTDSEQLKLAKINPTETIILPQTIQPTSVVDPSAFLTTYTFFTTFYKDGTKITSSREETKSENFDDTSTPPVESKPSYTVLTYPTTYYTTLTYFTTLLKDGSTEVITSETVVSNVATPLLSELPKTSIKETEPPRKIESTLAPTTYYTTYTYFTTFHKDGTTSVSTTYKTVSNVIPIGDFTSSTPSITIFETNSADSKLHEIPQMTTYYTTYTYYTTFLRSGNPVVSSREEVVTSIGKISSTEPTEILKTKAPIESPQKTTFYTTYTYYTTLLKDGRTTVSTRKETVSNVIQGHSSSVLASPISRTVSPSDIQSTPKMEILKTYFTTYTYYTTFLQDGSSVVSSEKSTVTNVVTENFPSTSALPKATSLSTASSFKLLPSSTRSFATYYTTLTSYYTLFNAGKPSVNTVYSTLTDVVALATPTQDLKTVASKEPIKSSPVLATYFTTYTYHTTLMNSGTPITSTRVVTTSKVVTLSSDVDPSTIVHAVTPFLTLDKEKVQPTAVLTKTYYTTYSFFTTYLSKGQPSVSTRFETVTNFVTETITKTQTELPSTTAIITQSSPTSDHSTTIQGSYEITTKHLSTVTPTTYYTTYTYFTTLLSGGSSVIKSNTHVVSSSVNKEDFTKTDFSVRPTDSNTFKVISTPLSTLTNTIYTTFTFYTTLFPNGSPEIRTRYETSSNVITITVTPTLTESFIKSTSDLEAAEGELHEKRVHPTPVVTYYTTHTYVTTSVQPDGGISFITREVVASATVKQSISPIDDKSESPTPVQLCCSHSTQYPYTFFTTYTYYTTRFHGERPIINTRYETITNVIKAPIISTTIFETSTVKELSESDKFSIASSTTLNEESKFTPTSEIVASSNTDYEPASPRVGKPDVIKSRRVDDNINVPLTTSLKSVNTENVGHGTTKLTSENPTDVSTHSYEVTTEQGITSDVTTSQTVSTKENTSGITGTEEKKDMNQISVNAEPELSTETASTDELTTSDHNNLTDAYILESSTQVTENLTTVISEDTEQTTTQESVSSVETTTVTEAPKRSIFSRRRNRPVYKPRPSFRSSSTTTSTPPTTKSPNRIRSSTTTRAPSSFSRRNSTRLLYRRPSLAPRVNPLQRLRPLRPTRKPLNDSDSEETVARRRRRSFFHPDVSYDAILNQRKLLSTPDEEGNDRSLKNNDLISEKNSGSSNWRNSEKEHYPLGLIRSMEAKAINNGVTTVYGTEIHGTFINGVYAQVVQSKVRVYSDTSNEIEKTPFFSPASATDDPPKLSSTETNRVGLVSSKINTSVKDGTTTVYTTNVYGTYIGDVYAHLAQTTSSIIQPTPTIQNQRATGLISSMIRSEENYGTTTLWTTHIYGTFVNNYYAHIASTFSNVFVNSDRSTQTTPLLFDSQNQPYVQATPDIKISTPSPRLEEPPREYKTGLLSSILSNEESDGTTTQYITNIYGTYIGNHYAKHAQTTSRVILPSKVENPTRSVGLLSTLVNSVINNNLATYYKTEIFGTYIGQHYAQLARTTTEYKVLPTRPSESSTQLQMQQKTGLLSSSIVRSEVNSGTTTMHINEIYGTYIGNAYAHVAKSTSKVIKPTETESKSANSATSQKTGLISSSVKTEVNDGTTTLHIAEVHGTYVGNYYAHVARRTSTVLPFIPMTTKTAEHHPPSTVNTRPEGLISSEIRTEVNQGTTTLHTREIHATYIGGYYAHVARSTSNIITPTVSSSTTGLLSAITSTEVNDGVTTLHTTEIFGTKINGYYAHVARSTSNVVTTMSIAVTSQRPIGVLSTTTSTEINNGDTTLHRTSVIGTEVDGTYTQSLKVFSSIIYASHLFPEAITKPFSDVDSKTLLSLRSAKDDLDTARVNELDNGNQYISLTEDSDLGLKTPLNLQSETELLSPSVKTELPFAKSTEQSTPSLFSSTIIGIETNNEKPFASASTATNSEPLDKFTTEITAASIVELNSEEPNKLVKKEDKTPKPPTDDYDDYNDYVDNKTFKDKESVTSKPTVREQGNLRKNKAPTISSSRKAESDNDYDDYGFEDDYEDFEDRKMNRKITPSLSSSRFKNTRQSKRKSTTYNNKDFEDYDDYDDYNENETTSAKPTKSSDISSKETPSSSIRIRPFTGRGRPTYTTPSRSSTKASFTIQFRRPSRTRNSRAFGHRSDSENDFDDDLNEEEEEGDIEASEAVVTTATPQVLSFSRRKPFGSSRYQPPGRNSPSSTTPRPLNLGRNRRPFGRSTAVHPSPTPSIKDTIPDYEENTTEDDDFDEYDDISDKKEANRNRNFRSTRRPPRLNRFGERRSASNKRGFRHREEEETENDDFDSTTPNYRNSRNRLNQRKSSRGRYNRNNSPSLKSSFNSVSRDEDEDSQSLQPLNRIRNNNRNRRPSYNPRTRRPSKTATETQTIKKPYLTVTSVVTTVKTLPIYHGFRTSYATLTTTALDTSIINPTQYSEIVSDGVTKTLFYSKTGYPDGIENLHTTITEVVVTTTSLASVKLVPIKIGFSTRTDTITDIQVLTTLSTMYSTITPDTPQPTAFPQQFQPNFFPQLGPQNPVFPPNPQNPQEFGLLASANSFVTTQIVTSTTVVPIILRGRTILSTLTTTSTSESTVVRVPQVPSAAPFIPQPYFAFQPLTTLLTLYVTGEHGELKPVVTTVTVPLYQQPVFHTKVARSLQQNAVTERTLKTADIMDFPLRSSIGHEHSRDMDIDTHYDKLLSSGLEEINDLAEMSSSYIQTEPLDNTRVASSQSSIISYDVTTISKGPLTEIYEQKVTINLNAAENSATQNEIDSYGDVYGLEFRYSFRKLQQIIEEEPIFRPQRDFTRLRRPPPAVIVATAANPSALPQSSTNTILPRSRSRQTSYFRRPPVEIFNEQPSQAANLGNRFPGSSLARRPQRRPEENFRPFIERPNPVSSNSENDLIRSFESDSRIEPSRTLSATRDLVRTGSLLTSLQDANRNTKEFSRFVGSPLETENHEGFRPLASPPGLRRGPGLTLDEPNPQPDISIRPRRLRITRPINGEYPSNGLRRITRVRASSAVTSSVPPRDEITSTSERHSLTITPAENQPSRLTDVIEHATEEAENPLYDDEVNLTGDDNGGRRTVIKRLKPSFVPGDGSGARRPLVVRRTRIHDHSGSSLLPHATVETESPVTKTPEISKSMDFNPTATVPAVTEENEELNNYNKPPVKKIVRLRKPDNINSVPSGQRRRIVISRKPTDSNIIISNAIQARGPVTSVSDISDNQRNNFISDNAHLFPDDNHDLDDHFNRIAVINEQSSSDLNAIPILASRAFPITYYTTLTYFTTFLHGPETKYASREAIFSNVIEQTLNPNLVSAIKSNNGKITPTNGADIVHLASRTLGDTTTIVNLASVQNIFNSEVYKLINEEAYASKVTVPRPQPTSTKNIQILSTANIDAIAKLPKTYITLFTYSYTFYDGINKRESTRAETMTKLATDPSQFLTDSIGSQIDEDGYLIVAPQTRTVHLGSREVEGTTTEVNLGLKTLIKVEGVRNIAIEKTQPFEYITPSRSFVSELHTAISTSQLVTPLPAFSLEPSYASANELFDTNQLNRATETSPLISSIVYESSAETVEPKPVVKVTSIIHKPSGPLRSGVFVPRPGVRVRVRPVVSRRVVPSDLVSSFDISYDINNLATDRPEEYLVSPQYIPPALSMGVVPTPVLEAPYFSTTPQDIGGSENEITTEELGVGIDDATSIDGLVVPSRKKLKVTVRRPQSESVSRTHTRFVLPSRFEITSRPRFYVVTRTGALGVVSNSQRPFTVKISRKLKPTTTELGLGPPSTTVIYDTYTTLTSVPVIFGLDTSFRNVLLTTSSPITVSFVPTPTYESESPVIMPSTVILTYFTTTTFTIPYIVGNDTLLTTLEETNSRVVTQTLDGLDTLSYSTITRTPFEGEIIPTVSPVTSIEYGIGGPTTYTLSSVPLITTYVDQSSETTRPFEEVSTPVVYETKTFYTTYTFFTTFFAGTEPVVSSSEQVVTNVVTVPVTKEISSVPFISPSITGPVTVFDTSETVVTKTNYNTVTFYATLFSDTSSFVTPIEEIETQLQTITETYTITRTILPTPSPSLLPAIATETTTTTSIETTAKSELEPSVLVTQTLYTTFTNFVTLFQDSETIVTNLEETVSNIITLTLPADVASSLTLTSTPTVESIPYEVFTSQQSPVYTTREVLNTQTHYITLFNNGDSLLSTIEEVVTTYVTELATLSTPSYILETSFTSSPELLLVSSKLPVSSFESFTPPEETTESTSEIHTYQPELVPSIRTIYSTLTFYTTYYSDTSSIVASQEEVLTSYVTLFVPPSLITSTETTTDVKSLESTTDPSVYVFTTTDYSTLTLYTTLFSGDDIVVISSEHVVPEVITATITPTSTSSQTETATSGQSVLTFLTTFTYYTTYFSGTDPVVASSESVVTQFVTIEAPPSITPTSEILIESTPVETILGVSTASAGDIISSFETDIKIIGISSAIATSTAISPSIETMIQVESKVHSEVGSTPIISSSIEPSVQSDLMSSSIDELSAFISSFEVSKSPVIYEPSEQLSSKESSLPVTSTSIITEDTEVIGIDGHITTLMPSDTLKLVTGFDGFVTKVPEIATVSLSPVFIPEVKESASSTPSEIKPATVIELSDLLGGNTALGGDIGLAIQDIVSRITGKKNKTETDGAITEVTTTDATTEEQNVTELTTETSKFTEITTEQGEVENTSVTTTGSITTEEDRKTTKDIDYPIFILPDDTKNDSRKESLELAPVYVPASVPTESKKTSTLQISTSTTVSSSESLPSKSVVPPASVSTSVITGARTVFIVPTKQSTVTDHSKDTYNIVSDSEKKIPKLETSKEFSIDSSMTSKDITTTVTPQLKPSIGTSVVSGVRTVFFGSISGKSTNPQSSVSTATDSILGRANAQLEGSKTFTTVTKDGQTVISRTTSGATTIFFPAQIPKFTTPVLSTRYITSVESITRTLALTTTRTYYTRDSTLMVPSVYTTTIPPRTFVSTIIGTRTILGILPEPSETVQIHKTIQPSEHTTTVTTTTLIFNSIPSTVIRTLVLPTGVPTKTIRSETSSSYSVSDSDIFSAGTEKPAKPPEVGDSTSLSNTDASQNTEEKNISEKPHQKARDETYLRAAGPRLHDFKPDVRLEETVHRPPIVVTESVRPEKDPFMNGRNGICDPKCQPYKKEICKGEKGFWTCQCRPGHARRDEHEICKEIQTFVVLLKVIKFGNESIDYNNALSDSSSGEYKNFVKNAMEGIADAYSISNVRDHIWDAEVNSIIPADAMPTNADATVTPSINSGAAGVIVNFTLQVSKSVSGNLLEQELTRSLQLSEMKVGDSALLAAPLAQTVQDYDECLDIRHNDCALRATCVNLPGTYTCQCNEGFEDMDLTLPGRTCLAKTENCNYCHGRGDCLRGDDEKTFCRCQPMFVGRRCEINGLVLAIALPTAVAVVILLLCAVLCCCRKCKRKAPSTNPGDPGSVFRGIALKGPVGGTLDRKAMIDTSSESSGEHGRKGPNPFEGYQESGDVTPYKSSKRSDLSLNRSLSTGYTSPPVMIPRARQPQGPNKPMNYTVYDGQVYVW